MKTFLYVGAGGFIGALLRFYVSSWVQHASGQGHFPIGTLVVNLAGCLILGFIGGYAEHFGIPEEIRLLIMIGLLGSFTTFSTFSYDTLTLLRNQSIFFAILNAGVQVIAGLTAAWAGYSLSRYAG